MANGIYSAVLNITPQLAKSFLEKNTRNRKISPSRVNMYTRDMKNKMWQLTPQGISFYENGDLADGQHRLLAIVKSGETIQMLVTYNVPNGTTMLDRGYGRTLSNVLDLDGFPSTIANAKVVSIVNLLFREVNSSSILQPTDMQIKEFIKLAPYTLESAIQVSGKGANHAISSKAGCNAAAFCALYEGLNKERLEKFFTVVNTGFYDTEEETAGIVLRNYLQSRSGMSGRAAAHYAFLQTTNAIHDYMMYKPRKKVYSNYSNPFYFANVKDEILKIMEVHTND